MHQGKCVILIPTYNERDSIGLLVPEIFALHPEVYVTVIDDSSPDGTAEVVRKLMKKYPHLTLLLRPAKQGLGEAYKQGIAETLTDENVTRVITMDADGSHAAEHLGALLAHPEYGLVVGSRYTRGGGVDEWELLRRLLSRYGNLYARLITGVPIRDMTAGFMSFDANLLRRLTLSDFRSSGYAFLMELKYQCTRVLGANALEVPIIFLLRRGGQSKLTRGIILEGLATPWRLRFKKIDQTKVCPLCSKAAKFFATKNKCDLWRCRACAFIFVDPVPSVATLYSRDYFSGAGAGHGYANYDADKVPMIPTFEEYVRRIRMLSPRGRTLLDVGAATGFFMAIAQKRGFEVSGVELSDYAAAIGRKNGLSIQTGTLADIPSQPPFDVITVLDVIEHVSDPRAELVAIHERLAQGGLVVINTPDTGSLYAKLLGRYWHLIVPPEHLYYFNRRNLSMLLTQLGFKVEMVTTIGKEFTLPYICTTLYQWQGFRFWKWLARWTERSGLRRVAIPINLGDNMFLIARKV